MILTRDQKKQPICELKHRIVFQQKVSTPDGEGGFNETRVDFLPRWAAVIPIRAQQRFDFRSVNVEATHWVKTRGYLTLPSTAKRAGGIWEITWSVAVIAGATVRIHYRINGGPWVPVALSAANDGEYVWSVPEEAAGENVVVRVMHATDDTEYVLTDACLVVASVVVDRNVNENDQILFGERIFEILTIEDIQERDFTKFITCREQRG
jgi:head-tail adaptor